MLNPGVQNVADVVRLADFIQFLILMPLKNVVLQWLATLQSALDGA
ncbi:MAG: hypothetical protein ACLUPK_06630 [Veillonella sp.]